MASYLNPLLYATFMWWFSTGAVLLLVARADRGMPLRAVAVVALLTVSLIGLAASADSTSVAGAYIAFSATILLWGAQEVAFLTGWVTGPRPLPCPAGATGWPRLAFALKAILYHELALLVCGAAVATLTFSTANQVGCWTFSALWVLRQSAKINLFLGVPVTNDALLPQPVQFLKSFFATKPVGAFFPLSVTLAIGTLAILIQRIVEIAATPTEIAGLALVSALFALGVIEHWFMLLPMPALTLWGWSMRSGSSSEGRAMDTESRVPNPIVQRVAAPPDHPGPIVVLSERRADGVSKATSNGARQRLEDQFRQQFLQELGQNELAVARKNAVEPAVTVTGRTS